MTILFFKDDDYFKGREGIGNEKWNPEESGQRRMQNVKMNHRGHRGKKERYIGQAQKGEHKGQAQRTGKFAPTVDIF